MLRLELERTLAKVVALPGNGGMLTVESSPVADALIRAAPRPATKVVLAALNRSAARAPVKASRVTTLTDPEDPDWSELVVDILLDVDSDEQALSLWDDLGRQMDKARLGLSESDQEWFACHFGLHLHWGSDPWDEDNAAAV